MQAPTLLPLAQDETHSRLVEGFAAAVAEKGYAGTTIADIARHAKVSKRTFYEHFGDKEACLLETYEGVTKLIRQAMRAAWGEADPSAWEHQLDAGLDAYVGALEAMPLLTRACLGSARSSKRRLSGHRPGGACRAYQDPDRVVSAVGLAPLVSTTSGASALIRAVLQA